MSAASAFSSFLVRLRVPLTLVCVCAWCGLTLAQVPPGAAGQDPLMALMLSQPRIDVDSPVVPVAVFEPPVVKPGQEAVYRITFNALEASIKMPARIFSTPGAEMRAGAHGQLLVLSSTNYQPRTSFNFRVRPTQPGLLSIPAFKVKVYGKDVIVPAAQVQVVNDVPSDVPPAQTLRFEVPRTNIYVGQGLHASVTLPPASSLVLQHSSPLQITGEGLIVDPTTLRPRMELRRLGSGNDLPSIVYDIIVTPIVAGRVSAFAQAFVGSRLQPPIQPGAVFTGLPQYTLVDSDALQLEILPLPREGQLPGFTGAVGSFASEPPELSTNVLRVGEPVKLSVRIRGDGNLLRLVPPPPPKVEEWRVFSAEANPTHPQIIQAQGFTIFNYTLVPLTERASRTPRIPFSCFDPVPGRYVDATIPSISVVVLPGASPGDLKLLEQADAAGGIHEKEPVLSGLAASPGLAAGSLIPVQRQAWFPFLQLLPGVGFVGLWAWDRRRRFFEAHPDVLLKRRARRALRKQWRKARNAAAQQDVPGFVSGAVRALDIACSPFYPADPRALVGTDVLALLSDAERNGARGQAVRELFRAYDAGRFSTEPPGIDRGLGLEPELNALVLDLELKLKLGA